MQRVKLAYLHTPTKIQAFGGITTVSKETIKTATNIYRLEDGSIAIDIDDITYIIGAANIKVMAVERSDGTTEIKKK